MGQGFYGLVTVPDVQLTASKHSRLALLQFLVVCVLVDLMFG